jgi:hypothetical protein
MYWNIRIVHHHDIIPKSNSVSKVTKTVDWYALHECYYHKKGKNKGKCFGITDKPKFIYGDTPAELREYLLLCMRAVRGQNPIIDYDTRKECQHHLHSSQK